MATVLFSELEEIDRVCEELDPVTHHLTAAWLAQVTPAAREFLADYMRRALRGELVAGVVVRAAGQAMVQQGVATEAAVNGLLSEDFWERYRPTSYLRCNVWQYNLGRAGDEQIQFFWALVEGLGKPGDKQVPIQHPLVTSFYALLDAAHDRMFGSYELEMATSRTSD